jgi:peptide/nickel transport system permease protein
MLSLVLRRLFHAIPILLGVSLLVFSLVQIAPGDPIDILIPGEASKEASDRLRAEYGLDKPLPVQYGRWLSRAVRGDLGVSVFSGEPVLGELRAALFNTFLVAIPAALLGFLGGCVLGTLAAYRRGRFLDRFYSGIAIVGVSLPHYWAGIVLVAVFSVKLGWLPSAGMGDPGFPTSLEQLSYLILPISTLALIPMGVLARIVRTNVLEVLGQDYVSALRVKGLRERAVLLHVLKNAAPTVIAVMGLQFGYLLGGSILVETVFNYPGVGQLIALSIGRRDLPTIQGVVLILSTFFILTNLAVDVVQAYIDPRIRR